MNQTIKIGIIGAAGYAAGELIRILLNHPSAEIIFVQSISNAGNPVSQVHEDLFGETDLVFSLTYNTDIDLLFICSGHSEARIFLNDNPLAESVKIIDLSNDFRLKENAQLFNRNFIYGLPELNRKLIKTANAIANPGCFATAIELALLPLANKGILREVFTTGITGSTGAGQPLSKASHFSWRSNNIQAYKTLIHQHLTEINQTLLRLQQLDVIEINFVPWRGDFTRGIFTSTQLHCTFNIQELLQLYNEFYENHPFVFITTESIHLKQVTNTNKCIIQIEKVGDKLVIHSAIDNLLKGASGQAVQNMNLMFGLGETTGLKLKANYF